MDPSLVSHTLTLDAPNRAAVLRCLAAEAANRVGRPEAAILAALEAREALGSTALGRGVALPHAMLPGDLSPLLLVARLRRPVDFEARDGEAVDVVLLVLWPEASPEAFLRTLSAICRPLRDPATLRQLRAAGPGEVSSLLGLPSPPDAAPGRA